MLNFREYINKVAHHIDETSKYLKLNILETLLIRLEDYLRETLKQDIRQNIVSNLNPH